MFPARPRRPTPITKPWRRPSCWCRRAFRGYVPARHPALRYGIALNDAGYFWESQEILEAVWAAAPQGGRERILLRACIQIANANLRLAHEEAERGGAVLPRGAGRTRYAPARRSPAATDLPMAFRAPRWRRCCGPNWRCRCYPRPIGSKSAPSAEYEAKCRFWRLEGPRRIRKHALLCMLADNQSRTVRVAHGWRSPVKIASSLAAPATSIFRPSRRATGTGSSPSTATSRR